VIPLPVLQWPVVAVGLAVMVGVGFAAGVIPAWRAARVDPAEIMRVE
jgi:ABC-type antimicrobial peptide transport system permease subunit